MPTRTLAEAQRDLTPHWGDYRGVHQPCAACVIRLHEAGGVGSLPRAARAVRTVKATGERTLLCEPCAGPLRAADWTNSPRGRRATAASKGARR